MKAKRPRPDYIRIVAPDERDTSPYRVKGLGPGISPDELYQRECNLPGTILSVYTALLSHPDPTAAERFLVRGVESGIVRRYKTRSGRWCYRVPICCLQPDAEKRSAAFLVRFIAKCTGETVRQVKARIRKEGRERRELEDRQRRQCTRNCGCFENDLRCGLDGRYYPADLRRLKALRDEGYDVDIGSPDF